MFSKDSIAYLKKALRESKVSQGPLDLQILPTTRCNARCIFCPPNAVSQPAIARFAPRWQLKETELNFGVFDRLCDDLYRLGGLKRIHITGGEPLLYKRIIPVIFLLRRTFPDAEIALVTNGILLSEFAVALAHSGIDRISISVNAGTESSFEIQSGVSGSNLAKIKQGIKILRQEREKHSQKKPYLSLTAVLNKHNYLEVESILEFALDAGADAVSYLPLMDFPFPEEKPRPFALTAQEFNQFWQKLAKVQTQARSKKIYLGYTGFPAHQGKLRAGDIYQRVSCYAGYSFAMVWPDGSVRSCCNCEESLGNLHKQSFYQIWNSLWAQKFRDRLLKIPTQGPPERCDCLECGYLFENQEFHRLIEKDE